MQKENNLEWCSFCLENDSNTFWISEYVEKESFHSLCQKHFDHLCLNESDTVWKNEFNIEELLNNAISSLK